MVSDVEPTTTVAGLETNTLADGFFHAVTWCVLVVASVVTIRQWRAGRLAPSRPVHLGAVLAGWGGFNLVEGLVDHQLLGIHHVRDDLGGPFAWDLGFLVVSAALLLAGWGLLRHGSGTLRRTR